MFCFDNFIFSEAHPPLLTRGSTNLNARSVNKFPIMTTRAEKNKMPRIVGVSLAIIESNARVPNPGHEKTDSTRLHLKQRLKIASQLM